MNYLILQKSLGAGQTVQDMPIVFPESIDPTDLLTALATIPALANVSVIGGGQCGAYSINPQCQGRLTGAVFSRYQDDNEVLLGMNVTKGLLRQVPDAAQATLVPPV